MIQRMLAGLAAGVCALGGASASADVEPSMAPVPEARVSLVLDSGAVVNRAAARAVVFSEVVSVPGSPWLRLMFARADLAPGAVIRVTSLWDGYSQTLDAEGLRQWGNTSAYFNGDSVKVEIIADAGVGPSRVVMLEGVAGLHSVADSICGPTDDRVRSFDNRQGRVMPIGCTAWSINDCVHCFLTAGHCMGAGLQCVQFNVPLSLPNGTLQNPPPEDQYSVDITSSQGEDGGIGADWGYFGVFPNTQHGMTPFERYGRQAYAFEGSTPAGSQSVVAGGYFTTAGGVPANRIARWNGYSWSPMGFGMDDIVVALAALPNGDIVAGGLFTNAGGVAANRIARWDGARWWPLGNGMNGAVLALAALPNGSVVAGGEFTFAGGVAANRIALWNGASWSPLGSGIDNSGVYVLAVMPSGDIVAGGGFSSAGGVGVNNLARWNGTRWSAMGGVNGGVFPYVNSLAVTPGGQLIIGGSFTSVAGVSAQNLARWNGLSWSPMGFDNNGGVYALAVLANGEPVTSAAFFGCAEYAIQVASWNGASWACFGSQVYGIVFRFAVLPTGDLIAGGGNLAMPNGTNMNSIARYDGLTWSGLGSGMNDRVTALVAAPDRARVTGYGETSPRSGLNQVQQSHVGDIIGFEDATLSHTADTTGGSSGAPVLLERTGKAVAIHTHGGCALVGGANFGTRLTYGSLQSAMSNPRGVCSGPLRADVNGDGAVNFDDLVTVLGHYGQQAPQGVPGRPFGDFDGDGWVRFADLAVLLGVYGRSCE